MFGLAPGSDVQVRFVTEHTWSLQGIVLIVLREFLEGVERLLVNQVALLDPAFEAAGGADTGKAFFAIEDLDSVAILYGAEAVVHGRDLVPQRSLGGRDVRDFEHAVSAAATGNSTDRR